MAVILFLIISVITYAVINMVFYIRQRRRRCSEELNNRSNSVSSNIAHANPAPVVQQAFFLEHTVNSGGRCILFKFKYIYKQGSWRAYIMNKTDYAGRSIDAHITHRHYDFTLHLYYICWNCKVNMLDDMVSISKVWADATTKYILTGKQF